MAARNPAGIAAKPEMSHPDAINAAANPIEVAVNKREVPPDADPAPSSLFASPAA